VWSWVGFLAFGVVVGGFLAFGVVVDGFPGVWRGRGWVSWRELVLLGVGEWGIRARGTPRSLEPRRDGRATPRWAERGARAAEQWRSDSA